MFLQLGSKNILHYQWSGKGIRGNQRRRNGISVKSLCEELVMSRERSVLSSQKGESKM